ncbi:olfactory receptor 52E4-like [Triplophysa rosa]|uniref:Main Olfactory Receptor n=1 Tax=Triplophysa rosa TaxID=992332 RepID=A0A9W7W7W8_TRIRA|nr:olfactory receptor 52E4-like [Triplophysa rosa]XP_057206538.1 olfactory receptor 52E4-like [Triplophysa rosa]KAI7789223.1 Main Olfactory Receptor [Triplophysa rosa]
MNVINTSVSLNISVVRPEYFFITGLSGIPYTRYHYIFLFCIYFIAVIGNCAVLVIIVVNRSLHSPKYISVFNLALADLGITNAQIPNIVRTFLFESQYISYNACLANMTFVYFFSGTQVLTLVVLAYDRFTAICLPLRYHAIVTNTVMFVVFSAIYALTAVMIIIMVYFISRLSFCKTNVIESYFCDHGPVYRLACNDNSNSASHAKLITGVYLLGPFPIIVISYLAIFLVLSKITNWEGCIKALRTCASHLLVVGLVYLPKTCIYIIAFTTYLSPNARIISSSLSYVIPPMLNPMIYVLNTAEIKDTIRKAFKNRSGPGVLN